VKGEPRHCTSGKHDLSLIRKKKRAGGKEKKRKRREWNRNRNSVGSVHYSDGLPVKTR